MNILIIGSRGFIGQHLVTYFERENYVVHQADIQVDHVAKNYTFLSNFSLNLLDLIEEVKPDICINASGAASVPKSIEEPLKDLTANSYNVAIILDALRKKANECKFINFSSAAIYGNPEKLPIGEEAISAPISPYGLHKKMSEEICQQYHKFYGLKTSSLRVFSAYGEGLKKQLFWDLYQKIKQEENLNLFGTGNESRDFIHVHDICIACHRIIERSSFDGEVVNVANGRELQIKDIVKVFLHTMKSNKKPNFRGTTRKGDPNNWCADITKIKAYGYRQSVSIDEGINRYVQWASNEFS